MNSMVRRNIKKPMMGVMLSACLPAHLYVCVLSPHNPKQPPLPATIVDSCVYMLVCVFAHAFDARRKLRKKVLVLVVLQGKGHSSLVRRIVEKEFMS
jgi:hypothetical protein